MSCTESNVLAATDTLVAAATPATANPAPQPAFGLPRINEPAPPFKAKTTHGDRSLEDYRGK